MTSHDNSNRASAIQSYVKYFNNVKPYHSKILEVLEQYNFSDDTVSTSINEVVEGDYTLTPLSLFSNNEGGFLMYPFQDGTLYQEKEGQTKPNPNDLVSLSLDYKNKLAFENEIFNEQTPTITTSGTASGSYDVVNRIMASDGVNSGQIYFDFPLSLSTDSWYYFEIELSGALSLLTTNGIYTDSIFVFGSTGSGSYHGYTKGDGDFRITMEGTSAGELLIDKFSIRELPGSHAVQYTAGNRPTFRDSPFRLEIDKVDDNLTIEVPTGGWTGTMIIATTDGSASYPLDVPAGPYDLVKGAGQYFPGTDIVGYLMIDRGLTQQEITDSINFFVNKGAKIDYSGSTDLSNWYRDRTEIVSIPNIGDMSDVTNFTRFISNATNLDSINVSNWNTSNTVSFVSFANGASSLKSLDVDGWDVSSVTSFSNFLNGCVSLTSLDISIWNTSSVTNFEYFAYNCTGLTTLTLNGGTGNPFADSPCTNYVNAFTNTNLTQQSIDDILIAIEAAGTSTGTFDQSGGFAPSVTGQTAIDGLRARGWTVTVTGGY